MVSEKIEIRETVASDFDELPAVYARAFPAEDLLALVKALCEATSGTLSLVAVEGARIVGHVVFTTCHVDGAPHTVALLAPLAVLPNRQKQGIGSALVRAGFGLLKSANVARIYVLGDPAYYARFGFAPDFDVTPPYALPEEWRTAWQSCTLNPAVSALSGMLKPPQPWLQPRLWAP